MSYTHNSPIPFLKLCGLTAALAASSAFALASAQPRPTPKPTPYQLDSPPAAAAQGDATETEIVLRWKPTPRVARYRVQVSRDANFGDIIFDGAVNGLEKKVTGLPPGRYHWRVAPAPKETGRYSAGEEIEAVAGVTPRPVLTPTPPPRAVIETPTTRPAALLSSPRDVGWQAAVGNVLRPVPARLRPGQSFDLVAVNSAGTVYALEGPNGAALWTARFRPATRGPVATAALPEVFTPLVYTPPQREVANVLVAFDGGVRMLEGETGRELWRVALEGRAAAGAVGELDGNTDAPDIAVVTGEPSALYFVEGATGRVVSKTKLDTAVIGVPVPYQSGADRGVALTLEGAQLEVRAADGKRLRGVKFDVAFVTPPLVIAASQGTVVIVGTAHGLLFLNGADLKPLGRVTTPEDAPRGRLAAANLDNDSSIEIVMVTKRGRLVVVNAQGRIVWSADAGADAYSPAFADLDRDGALDVIVADSKVFARGYSGRDGTPIWQADNVPVTGVASERVEDAARPPRSLTVAAVTGTDSFLIVGGDSARSAVRAVGLPVVIGRASAR